MFRLSLIVCVSLLCGITAKPHKPLNKRTDAAFQDTVMSIDERGKMSVEVEPPEDMDATHYDVDPDMMIWKRMQQPVKSEEDLDRQLDAYLAPLRADYSAGAKVHVVYSEPEKDEDELYHRDGPSSPVQVEPLARGVRADANVRVHLRPEEDMDELYHKDVPQPMFFQDLAEAAAPADWPSQRWHSEPEEDMDDLYHQ